MTVDEIGSLPLDELYKEYDHWNKLANSGNNSNVTGFAHAMRKAADKWIRIREDEARRLCSQGESDTSS